MNRRAHILMIAAALLAAPLSAHATLAKADAQSARERMEILAKAKKKSFPLEKPSIHVMKEKRTLELKDGDTVIKTYTVALGTSPTGPKTKEGDRRTPEGTYFVCGKNDASQFHIFLGLSYPNAADAASGKKDGVIDAATAKRIAQAEKDREKPDWFTKLGGAVGIHGGGTGNDWTWGCVALSDADVDEIWVAAPDGTPVIIDP